MLHVSKRQSFQNSFNATYTIRCRSTLIQEHSGHTSVSLFDPDWTCMLCEAGWRIPVKALTALSRS